MKILIFDKNRIHHYNEIVFNIFIILSYISYFSIMFGFTSIDIKYLTTINFYIRLYICLFLLFRFNPFRNVHFTDLDRKFVFNSSLFILSTLLVNDTSKEYINKIQKYFGYNTDNSIKNKDQYVKLHS